MRIPLATTIKTRTGVPAGKDARLVNSLVEVKGDQGIVRKRCGVDNAVTITVGTAQGIFPITINGAQLIVAVSGDTVSAGTTNTPDDSFAPLIQNWYGINSCVEADVMAMYPTDDRGTSTYSGPSETPYTVPQTTNAYSIIGITPCGGLLRKCVTKTYASRSEVNQYKGYSGVVADYANVVSGFAGASSYGLGATIQIAKQAAASSLYSAAPATVQYYAGGAWRTISKSSFTPNPVLTGTNTIDLNYNDGVYYRGMYTTGMTHSVVTLYYLDVTEVWTYALI